MAGGPYTPRPTTKIVIVSLFLMRFDFSTIQMSLRVYTRAYAMNDVAKMGDRRIRIGVATWFDGCARDTIWAG